MLRAPYGPELPTLAERFISLFRLPYLAGCVMLVFLVQGVPTLMLGNYLYGRDWPTIVAYFTGSGHPSFLSASNVASYFASLVGAVMVFYMPRYMRSKIAEAEGYLSTLLSGGENDFHRFFGTVSARRPQILCWTILLVVSRTNGFSDLRAGRISFFIFGTLQWAVLAIGLASVLWAYIASLRGIHLMGDASLRLTPYYVDSNLGLRPIGALAFSLAKVYFGLMGLAIVFSFSWIISDVVSLATLSGLILLGLLMFLLPMSTFHRRMLQTKQVEHDKLAQKMVDALQNPALSDSKNAADLLRVELMDKKLSSAATWPFDTQIMGKFSVIVLSATAALLARLIAPFLGI